MNWMRLATIALGAGCVVASFLIPPAAPALMPAGTFLVGYGLTAPGSKSAEPPPKPASK